MKSVFSILFYFYDPTRLSSRAAAASHAQLHSHRSSAASVAAKGKNGPHAHNNSAHNNDDGNNNDDDNEHSAMSRDLHEMRQAAAAAAELRATNEKLAADNQVPYCGRSGRWGMGNASNCESLQS